MNKIIDVIIPKVYIDDALFQKAPNETLRAFVKQLQNRLARLEIIVISAAVYPYIPFDKM